MLYELSVQAKAMARGVIVSAFAVHALLAQGLGAEQPQIDRGRLTTYHVQSRALANNRAGDSALQRVDVYLPPGYERESARRYPVVYVLHGFLGSPNDFTKPTFGGMTVQGAMDTLIASRRVQEMIVVVPNGNNGNGGSFYVNSPATGNWGDYLLRDVIPWVDRTFRTIPSAAGRGLAGHSMGGYAALVQGMQHPELFGAIYAMSPCCVDVPAEFGPQNPVWAKARAARTRDDFWRMLKAGDPWPIHVLAGLSVWFPDTLRAPLYVSWPEVHQGKFDSAFVARWQAQLPIELARKNVAALKGLRGLRIDAGMSDQYAHIPIATRAFSQRLADLNVAHVFELYDGDHRNRLGPRMSAVVLPFFSRVLGDSPPQPTPSQSTGTATRHLFYVPARSVDLLGVDSIARLTGDAHIDVRAVISRLEREGFSVHLASRPIRSMWDAADSLTRDVQQLVNAGVDPARISLLGHARGGTIAMIASAKLGLPGLRVVALAPCTPDMLQSMAEQEDRVHLRGRILVLRTAGDHQTVSCQPLLSKVTPPATGAEVTLPSERGPVEFSIPRDEWISAVVRHITTTER
jgi:enterochelin esterase-like enzyme